MRTARLLEETREPLRLARARPRVLIVGQPSPGGINTFIRQLLEDPWLGEHAELEYLPTPLPPNTQPGALSAPNVRGALGHTAAVFRRARGADVVHLNMAGAPILPLSRAVTLATAARSAGARVILHLHTGMVETSLRSREYRTLFRVVTRLADRLIVVSHPAEDAVAAIAGNVRRIGNGIDVRRFATGPKGEPPVLLYVGTVSEAKGLLDLRDALVSMRWDGEQSMRVVIAGDGTQDGPGAFERIQRAFEDAGLSNVWFMGEVGPEEVAGLLARANIVCLPSHGEGFPFTVLEAMASEAAVVATTVGDIPHILAEGSGLLVEPRDPEGLAAAIGKLLANPEEREEMGRRARARVKREFAQMDVTRALLDTYREVAAES
ncbi:MAG: glycosyltransferase family 4 protein [Actinomycetota bacterium]